MTEAAQWTALDLGEVLIALKDRFGGPGQTNSTKNSDKIYLPIFGPTCRAVVSIRGKKLKCVERGDAFTPSEWESVSKEIQDSLRSGPKKFGIDFSFSSEPVQGSWRGVRSGVSILPAPATAPRTNWGNEHPFILCFPIQENSNRQITNYRRRREHKKLTLLLNALLTRRISFMLDRADHCWAVVSDASADTKVKWVQRTYFADFGQPLVAEQPPEATALLPTVEPIEYYQRGLSLELRAPTDLDDSICRYLGLSEEQRAKFDRALFWLDMASRVWNTSMSMSFTALVSAIESLTERGERHSIICPKCEGVLHHEVPGPTKLFREFLEKFAEGGGLKRQRKEMYSVRSGILHGTDLMQLDQMVAVGVAPLWFDETELHGQLSSLTRLGFT